MKFTLLVAAVAANRYEHMNEDELLVSLSTTPETVASMTAKSPHRSTSSSSSTTSSPASSDSTSRGCSPSTCCSVRGNHGSSHESFRNANELIKLAQVELPFKNQSFEVCYRSSIF